jgi:hypothetical protein
MTGNRSEDTDPGPHPDGLGPLPPHPAEYMTPERFAAWCCDLEEAAAQRGLPPEPWLPPEPASLPAPQLPEHPPEHGPVPGRVR